ncbi:MAG: glycosyltransferase [Limnochordaceae bacterium]|nr:glycosyltransferase [Limnochordaceae bacterium]
MPLVVDLTHFLHARSGGVRTYLRYKGRHLEAAGWRHAIIAPGARDGIRRLERSLLVTLWSPVVPGAAPYRVLVRTRAVLALLRRLRPSVIELGSPYLLPSVATAAGHQLGAPVVGFYHAHVPQAHLEPLIGMLGLARGGTVDRAASEAAWHYLRRVYRPLDRLAAPSAAMATELSRHGAVPPAGCTVIPLGVDTEDFHPRHRSAEWRAAHLVAGTPANGAGRVVVLYVGRLSPEKGAVRLVELAAELERAQPGRFAVWIVGDGPLRAQLQRAAPPNVGLLGHLEGPALRTAYASADVFVTASESETFGLAPLEAQASGLPVVAPASGALPEVVDPRSGRLVPSATPAALAAAVTALARQPSELAARGRSARAFVEGRFSWERTFRRLMALYADVLAARRRPALR